MCLARVVLGGENGDELLLEDVALVEVGPGALRLSTLFGEEREVQGVLKTVDLQNSRIVVERPARAPRGD